VEAVTFDTADPAFLGEMTLVVTFEEVSDGTDVTMLLQRLASGLASGGQRGWLAVVTGAAGAPLRMTGRDLRGAAVAAPSRKPKLTEPPRFSSRLQPVESVTDPEWQQQNQDQHRDAHEDTPNLLKR
jgi:hypothetical protein